MQRKVLMDRASHRNQMMQRGPGMDGHHMPMGPMSPMMRPMNPMMNPQMMNPQMMNPMMMDQAMDGRNPYGSKGGYIDSNYQDGRGRDYAMDRMDHNSEYGRGRDYSNGSDYRGSDYHMGNQPYGQYPGSMQFYGYGVGQMPMMDRNDYGDYNRGGRNDYNSDYANYNDYAMEEKEYEKHLHEWINKLKSKDRIRVSKDQVLRQAKNMNIKFDEFTEEEFYATYLMVISDFPNVTNDYNVYVGMAKNWLMDKDAKLQGSDKLCTYMYEIVLGKSKEEDDD